MKQKIVIEVPLRCAKCKKKVMSVVLVAQGVTSAEFQTQERDQVVIVGEEVDAAGLTERLRDKVKYARLVSVTKLQD